MNPDFISPTGEIVKEYLEEYCITQKEFCIRTGVSERHFSSFINGKTRLTEDLALKIEKVLNDIPASYWLSYESKYRENLARIEEKYSLSHLNLNEIAKRFKFSEVFDSLSLSLVEQAAEMLKLLKISTFDNFNKAYSNLSISFMEDGGKLESIAIWLNLCESEIEFQNSNIDSIDFSSSLIIKEIPRLKKLVPLTDIERALRNCTRLLNRCGVYLVFHEPITNSKVRGALTSYKGKPAIYLSGRFKTHDHLWFALFHEIGHLILHYNKKDTFITLEDEVNSQDLKELESNEFARNTLIELNDYNKFVARNDFTEAAICQFSAVHFIHPGILVSRLQRDGVIEYNQLSYLKLRL